MQLIDFVKGLSRVDLYRMVGFTVLAGFANALLVVAVNFVAGEVATGHQPGWLGGVTFIVVFCVYYFSGRYAMLRANSVVERMLKRLRLRTMSALRQSELVSFEQVGSSALSKVVAQETNHLSVAFPLLIDAMQQGVLLLASMLYLVYLSGLAFGIFCATIVIGLLGYSRINASFKSELKQASLKQTEMVDRITDIIDGSKELRLHAQKSESVFQSYCALSAQSEALMTDAGAHMASMILLMSGVVYAMLGVVAFVLPHYAPVSHAIVFQLVPTLLFCAGAVSRIVVQIPLFIRAELGLASIERINQQLELGSSAMVTQKAKEAAWLINGFKRIDYQDITYRYPAAQDDQSFTSGPWSLHLERGEIIFLVGGNGSGKSTALRLISLLYQSSSGNIMVDGKSTDAFARAGLREQFSAIFGDFHLFDRLYGLENIDAAEVQRLIDEMELTGKVSYADGRFTNLDLSTGQRKRLALIAALLEDRPIYAFDEWSAEQDVHFRDVFYRRILPQLRARGKTVVAVTHDERYWELADRIVKFDLGCIQWVHQGDTR